LLKWFALRVLNVAKNATYSKAITDLKAHGILPAPIELMQCAYEPCV